MEINIGIDNYKKNAIILAAGAGTRMVPINNQVHKALMKINGEILVERIIKQLQNVGVTEIYIVVGFMKEKFEYLTEKYGVDIIVNEEYTQKNNLHSLALASEYISNTYIVPADIWSLETPFRNEELTSWYMVSSRVSEDSIITARDDKVLVPSNGGNVMLGIAYITSNLSQILKDKLRRLDEEDKYNDAIWEEALIDGDEMLVQARFFNPNDIIEINTYEQLREFDDESNHLRSEAISVIMSALGVTNGEITNIHVLKKGMTNRSFIFSCKDKRYIMRIPGEGTDQLINREEEASIYSVIGGKGICDDVVYINPNNGYKITEFLENSRVCDSNNQNDLIQCMRKLRKFHEMKLKVNHEFDIYKQIDFYESLWNGKMSIYDDYYKTKERVFELRRYIDVHACEKVLTHIDAVPDNFLFSDSGSIRLIDWEYAGMQDPHVDIAMFCIYSLYDKEQIDNLIDIYFEGLCQLSTRLKIYCYIAAGGLLWSNWCEYKRNLGIEFGEYSLYQYKYAKEYYEIFKKESKVALLQKEGGIDESK